MDVKTADDSTLGDTAPAINFNFQPGHGILTHGFLDAALSAISTFGEDSEFLYKTSAADRALLGHNAPPKMATMAGRLCIARGKHNPGLVGILPSGQSVRPGKLYDLVGVLCCTVNR